MIRKITEYLKRKGKEKTEFEKEVSLKDGEELRKLRDDYKEKLDLLNNEISKKKAYTIKEKLGNTLWGMIEDGIIVLALGFIYILTIPHYFGVNNEFINPSNGTIGYNESMQMVATTIFNAFNEVAMSHTTLFFWLFWGAVFMSWIYPIFEFLYFLIRRKK